MKATREVAILVVEDDTALCDAYELILSSAGYIVTTAANGRIALDHIQQNRSDPDIILLDLRMPVLDGVGFLKEFNAENHPDTTIVVFSNFDDHRDINEAYKLGAQHYVLKARATPQDLLKLVETIIGKKQ